jgi:hypothetical protein
MGQERRRSPKTQQQDRADSAQRDREIAATKRQSEPRVQRDTTSLGALAQSLQASKPLPSRPIGTSKPLGLMKPGRRSMQR